MSFSLVYLAQRLFYRIFSFLERWYLGSFRFFIRKTVELLERLDRVLALKVSLRYWLKPLYQDYSFLGHILGFVFRTGRIAVAVLVYSIIGAIALFVYLLWILAPFYILYVGFYSYGQ